MALAPGFRLGPYEIGAQIGVGGMGEVYRATDTKLKRDVAIKVLPDALAGDADRLARFQREAEVLASLNHPNIAAIYGLEERQEGREGQEGQGGRTLALIMELVDGETLADRIAQGPIPEDEALRIARQITRALEVAHGQGIIHRDLKPANIKIRPDGTVKVLDFGLAKALDRDGASATASALSMSPTLTSPAHLRQGSGGQAMTQAGVILGTAAYMSPEQALGSAVDKRADIWALGCVLFEMLSAKSAFGGGNVAEVLASVLKSDPPWAHLGAAPPSVQTVIRRCLEKDPDQRIRDAADVRLALDGAFSPPAALPDVSPRRVWWMAAAAALTAAIAGGAVAWAALGRPAPEAPAVRFELEAPEGMRLQGTFVVSPDGRYATFAATNVSSESSLWVHSFESGESRQLDRAGRGGWVAFWSPDSRFVVYPSSDGLQKIDIDGGPPEVVAPMPDSYASAAWSPAGIIVLGRQAGGLLQTTPSTGVWTPLTALDAGRQEVGHEMPQLLPDGRHFLYLRHSSVPANSGIYVGEIGVAPDRQSTTRLLAAEQGLAFAPTGDSRVGYVLFLRQRTLMAQQMDLRSLVVEGEAEPVADGIGVSFDTWGHFSASATGVLAFRSAEASSGGTPTLVDRTGKELGPAVAQPPPNALYPRLSPDGSRLAVVVDGNVWVYHLDGRPPIKLTFAGDAFSPLWSPDGRQLAYEASGGAGIRAIDADGSRAEPDVLIPEGHYHPHGWSLDGQSLYVVSVGRTGNAGADILKMPLQGDRSLQPILATPQEEGFLGAAVSPDGRWLAYVTNVTGGSEIWARPLVGNGSPERISTSGGIQPEWSADGRTLYYIAGTQVMATDVDTRDGFRFSPSMSLFEFRYLQSAQPPSYAVTADDRFIVLKRPPAALAPVTVVVNWLSTLDARP